MKGKDIQKNLFSAFNAPRKYKATALCYRTKTFTVWLDDRTCVIYSFGERSPR